MYEHHTKEQAQEAFSRAQEVLDRLVAAGVKLPHIELFVDGSGRLVLDKERVADGKVIEASALTKEQWSLATELVRSQRVDWCVTCIYPVAEMTPHDHDIAIRFCCGLVTHPGVEETTLKPLDIVDDRPKKRRSLWSHITRGNG